MLIVLNPILLDTGKRTHLIFNIVKINANTTNIFPCKITMHVFVIIISRMQLNMVHLQIAIMAPMAKWEDLVQIISLRVDLLQKEGCW